MEEKAAELQRQVDALKAQLKTVVRTMLEFQDEMRAEKKRPREETKSDWQCVGRPWEDEPCAGCEYCAKQYKFNWEGKKQPICHSCRAAYVRHKKAKKDESV